MIQPTRTHAVRLAGSLRGHRPTNFSHEQMTSSTTLPRTQLNPIYRLLLAGLALTLLIPTVSAQRVAYKATSATQALASVRAYLGVQGESRIISMTAEEGRPQPLYWEFTLLEPAAQRGRRILRAGGGQVFYDRTPGGLPGSRGMTPVLELRRLKVDSERVFKIAEGEARKNRISFNHANYELRSLRPDTAPLWTVTMVDDRGDVVGKVDVDSASARILRSVWNPAKVDPAATANQRPGQPQQGPPPGAGQDQGGLERAGRALDRQFNKLRRAFD